VSKGIFSLQRLNFCEAQGFLMILGICGSPRVAATDFVLKEGLKILEEKGFTTKFYSIRGKNIRFCIHCDYCLTNKECALKDDMQEVYELLEKSEALVLATPVYNGGVTAQLKTILDRTRALLASNNSVFKGKPGIGIAVGGDRIGGQEPALQQIISFFVLNGFVTISGGFFGANLGATFWSKDTLKGVKSDKEGFKSLRKTMLNLSRYLEESRR
jgi:multimeric flavodoxin WrbA